MFGKQDWPGVWGHVTWRVKPRDYPSIGLRTNRVCFYSNWNAKWATLDFHLYVPYIISFSIFFGLPWFARDYEYYDEGGEWRWADIIFLRIFSRKAGL